MKTIFFFLLLTALAIFSSFISKAYATHLFSECQPNSILGSDPTQENLIDPDLCPPVTTQCWAKHPPANINYDCYNLPAVPIPTPTPRINPGTCSWKEEYPLTPRDSCTKPGYVPASVGNPFAPRCVCKLRGSPGTEAFLTPTPRPTPTITPTPQPLPCVVWLDDKDSPTTDKNKFAKCKEVQTAIGNFTTDTPGFIKSILGFLLSISGGVAFIRIIMGGYMLMTSQGDAQKVQDAQGYITSAIIGLLFIILSFVVLEIIGVDILKLPGFTR